MSPTFNQQPQKQLDRCPEHNNSGINGNNDVINGHGNDSRNGKMMINKQREQNQRKRSHPIIGRTCSSRGVHWTCGFLLLYATGNLTSITHFSTSKLSGSDIYSDTTITTSHVWNNTNSSSSRQYENKGETQHQEQQQQQQQERQEEHQRKSSISTQTKNTHDLTTQNNSNGNLRRSGIEMSSQRNINGNRAVVPSNFTDVYWWKPYVEVIARPFQPSKDTNWCQPSIATPPPREIISLLYQKQNQPDKKEFYGNQRFYKDYYHDEDRRSQMMERTLEGGNIIELESATAMRGRDKKDEYRLHRERIEHVDGNGNDDKVQDRHRHRQQMKYNHARGENYNDGKESRSVSTRQKLLQPTLTSSPMAKLESYHKVPPTRQQMTGRQQATLYHGREEEVDSPQEGIPVQRSNRRRLDTLYTSPRPVTTVTGNNNNNFSNNSKRNYATSTVFSEKDKEKFPGWRFVKTRSLMKNPQLATEYYMEASKNMNGLFFVKVPKTGSSTGAAISKQIAENVAERLNLNYSTTSSQRRNVIPKNADVSLSSTAATRSTASVSPVCNHHVRHGNWYTGREDPYFLWTMIRNPTKRAISYYFFENVSRTRAIPKTTGVINTLSNSKNYQLYYIGHDNHMETNEEGDGDDILEDDNKFDKDDDNAADERADEDHQSESIDKLGKENDGEEEDGDDASSGRTKKARSEWMAVDEQSGERIVQKIQQIFDRFHFIAVMERLDESLAVFSLLFDFVQVEDLIVLSSKQAGGYDDGQTLRGCVKIIKPTPGIINSTELKEYISTKYVAQNYDFFLYDVVNTSLDMTIDMLGTGRVQEQVEKIHSLRRLVDAHCQDVAVFPCTRAGRPNPESVKSCYFGDVGCGHACVRDTIQKYKEGKLSLPSITSS